MSGVIIDVDTNAEKAKFDLKALNAALGKLILNGDKAGRSIDKVDNKQFKSLDTAVRQSTASMRSFGREGSSSLRAVAADTASLRANIGLLKGSILGIGLAFAATKGVGAFTTAGDDLVNLRNQLKLTTIDTYNLTVRQRQLFQTAKETRTGFEGNVKVFNSFSNALRTANVSQERIVKLNKTIQQSATLSGGSVESINAAIIQLNQGIASGVLRGEEFNSVTEQLPYLATKMAAAIGVSIGELRRMAGEGQLTTDVLVKTLEKMSSSVDKEFKTTSVTADAGFKSFRQSLKYFLGDINTFTGFSGKIGQTFVSLGNGLNADKIITRIATISRAFDNYKTQLRQASVAALDLRKAFHLTDKDSTSDIQKQLKLQSKEMVERVKAFMEGRKAAEAGTTSLMSKIFNRNKKPSKEDDNGFFNLGDTRRTVRAIVDATAQVGRSFYIMGQNIGRVIPVILTPMIRLREDILSTFAIATKATDTFIYKSLLPLNRRLEAVRDVLTLGVNDDRGPRAISNMFQSKNIEEFAENVAIANNLFDDYLIRLNSLSYFLSEKKRFFVYSWLFPLQDVLINLGLMNQALFRIRDTRLDRTVQYLKLVGDSAKRVYDDLLAPDVNLFVYKIKIGMLVVLKTALDTMKETFTFRNGKEIGEQVVKGIFGAFRLLKDIVKGAFSFDAGDANAAELVDRIKGSIVGGLAGIPKLVAGLSAGIVAQFASGFGKINFDSVFDKLAKAFQQVVPFLQNTMASVIKYIQHLFENIDDVIDRVSESLGRFAKSARDIGNTDLGDAFTDMYKKIADNKLLNKTAKAITDFARHVKTEFFEIWDEVVGHSFWPDTIDDVNDYTKNLFKSTKSISEFKKIVLKAFESIYREIVNYGAKFGGAFQNIVNAMASINWTNATNNLATSLGSVIGAAFLLLRSKSTPIKFLATGYLFSIIDAATGGLLQKIAPTVGDVGGVIGGEFAKKMFASAFEGLALLGAAMPEFLKSLAGSFIPGLDKILNFADNLIPIFSNGMIGAIAAIGFAYAKFSGKKFKDIYSTIFGEVGKNGKIKKEALAPAFFEAYSGPLLGQAKRLAPAASIAKNLIAEKPFAIAAAAILGAGLTDAFKITDAFSAAVPFLAIALFGKTGGARFLKDATSLVLDLLLGVAKNISREAVTTLLPASVSGKIMGFVNGFDVAGMFTRQTQRAQAPLDTALKRISGNVAQMFANIEINRKKYAEGAIDLQSMLFTRRTPVGPNGPSNAVQRTDFKDSFAALGNSIGITRANVTASMTKLKDGIRKGIDSMLEVVQKGAVGLASGFTSIGANVVAFLKNNLEAVVAFMKRIIGSLGTLLSNRMFMVSTAVAIAVGMAGVAQAATDASTAFGMMGNSLAPVLVMALALTGAFKGFKFLGSTQSRAIKAKKTYINDTVKPELDRYRESLMEKRREKLEDYDAMDPIRRRRKYLPESRSKYAASLGADVAQKVRNREKEMNKYYAKDADEVFVKAFKAEWAGIFDGIKGFFSSSQSAIADSPLLTKSFWDEKAAFMQGFGKAVKASTAAAIANAAATRVNTASKAGNTKMGMFSNIIPPSRRLPAPAPQLLLTSRFTEASRAGAALGTTGGLMKSLKGLLVRSTGGLGLLATGARAVGGFLLGMLGPVALIGGGLALLAGAVVGLAGPFDSFTDNIKYAADKIGGFIGMTPLTNAGKQKELADEFGKISLANKKYDLTNPIMGLDLTKITAEEQEAIRNQLQTYADTLKTLNDAAVRQGGKLTEDQQLQAQAAFNEAQDILARQKTRDNYKPNTFAQKVAADQQRRGEADRSIEGNIKRFLGFSSAQEGLIDGRTIGEKLNDTAKAFNDSGVGQGAKSAAMKIKGFFDAIGAMAVGWAAAFNESEIGKGAKAAAMGIRGFFVGAGNLATDSFAWMRERMRDKTVEPIQARSKREQRFMAPALKNYDILPENFQQALQVSQQNYNDAIEKYGKSQDPKVIAYLDRLEKALERTANASARMGSMLAAAAKFKATIKDFATNMKELIDLGPNGEKFFGGDAERKRLEKLNAVRLRAIKMIELAPDFQRRQLGQQYEKSTKANANFQTELTGNRMLFGGRIESQSNAAGGMFSEEMLKRFGMSASAASKQFDTLSEKYLIAKAALDNAPADSTPAQLQKLAKAAGDLQAAMVKIGPIDISVEGINKGLSELGVAGISLEQYANLPVADIKEMASSLRDVKVAQVEANQALIDYEQGKVGIIAVQDALQGVIDKFGEAKLAAANARVSALANIQNLGLKGVAGADLAASITGDKPNARIRASSAKSDQFTKLSVQKSQADLTVAEYQPRLASGTLSAQEIAAYSQALTKSADIEEKLQKLGEAPPKEKKDKYGFKELLADINEAGIEISQLGFARLGQDARTALSGIASQIHGIEKELEKASPTQDVSAQLTRKAALLASMREKLVDAFGNTGKAIRESLDRSGLNDQAALESLTTDKLQKLIELDQKIMLKRAEADDTDSLEEYLSTMKEVASLERKRVLTLEKMVLTQDKLAEKINEVFNTNLNTSNIDLFGESFAKSIGEVAVAIKAKFAEMAAAGKASFEWLREVKRMGEFITLFDDFAVNLEDALSRGAKAGLEKVKSVIPGFEMTTREFSRMPREKRDKLVTEASNVDLIEQLSNLQLNKDQADVINKYGAGASAADVIAEFRSKFEADFKNVFAGMTSPLEVNNDRLGKLTTSVENLDATFKGSVIGANASVPVAGGIPSFDVLTNVVKTIESNGRRYGKGGGLLRSSAGALGEMQVLPSTARNPGFGVTPARSINDGDELARVGRDLLKAFLTKYGTIEKALAAYNAGPGNVNKAVRRANAEGGDFTQYLPSETKQYIAKAKRLLPAASEGDGPPIVVTAQKAEMAAPDRGPKGEANTAVYARIEEFKARNSTPNIDPKALRLGTLEQQAQLREYAARITELNLAIETALDAGKPTDNLAYQLQIVEEAMDSFSEKIVNVGEGFKNFLRDVGSAIDGNFKNALFDAFTGKGGFFKSLFDGLSTDFIRMATESIGNMLTGENGLLGGLFKSFLPKNKPSSGGFMDTGGIGGLLGGLFGGKKDGGLLGSGTFGGGPNADGSISLSGGGGLGSLFSPAKFAKLGGGVGSSILDAGTGIADTFGSTGANVAGDIAGSLTKAGDGVAKGLSGALGGLSAGGAAGLGSLAGGLFGMLIGSFFKDGGTVGDGNGKISGRGTGTSDSILAWVSNGEHITKERQAKKYRPLLNAINNDTLPKFADGGFVGASSVSNVIAVPTVSTIAEDKMPTVNNETRTEVNLGITGNVDKQTRATIIEMLPQIASAINSYNKEKGIR